MRPESDKVILRFSLVLDRSPDSAPHINVSNGVRSRGPLCRSRPLIDGWRYPPPLQVINAPPPKAATAKNVRIRVRGRVRRVRDRVKNRMRAFKSL
jgi:hypothetical protein